MYIRSNLICWPVRRTTTTECTPMLCMALFHNHLMSATPFHRHTDLNYLELYLDEVLTIRCSPRPNHTPGVEHSANTWLLSNAYENPGSAYIRAGRCTTHLFYYIFTKFVAAFIHAYTEMYVHLCRCTKPIGISIDERKGARFYIGK